MTFPNEEQSKKSIRVFKMIGKDLRKYIPYVGQSFNYGYGYNDYNFSVVCDGKDYDNVINFLHNKYDLKLGRKYSLENYKNAFLVYFDISEKLLDKLYVVSVLRNKLS